MERLFTEAQWRAIAEIEHMALSRWQHDGFHFWCVRKRIHGGVFDRGEFYIGQREDGREFRLLERSAGIDFSDAESKEEAIAEARRRITLIGDYLPTLIERWAEENRDLVTEWEERRATIAAQDAIRQAKAQARAQKKLKVGRRRRQIFAASEGHCHYCKTELVLTGEWHIEHKMPRALGGSNQPVNLVAACVPCNVRKRDKTDIEFAALLAKES